MVAVALFIHTFAGVCYPVRKLLLKDTGRKLAQVEMQISTCQSIFEALPEHRKEHSL
jgi:hypothetical protein